MRNGQRKCSVARLRTAVVACLLAAVVCLEGCGTKAPAPAPAPPSAGQRLELTEGRHTVAENDAFKLVLDARTAGVQVISRSTGTAYAAAPALTGEESVAGLAKAMVDIVYYNGYSKVGTMNSYDDAVASGQLEYYRLENGVRIVYTMGKVQKEFLVPPVVEKSRFEEKILSKAGDENRDMLLVYYRLIDLDAGDVTGEERQATLERYPKAAAEDLYVLASEYADYVMEELEGYIRPSGYSAADLAQDKQAYGIAPVPAQTRFTVPVDFTLNTDGVTAAVAMDEVSSALPQDVLTEVHLLRNFDAASAGEQGYFVVPDGSGALIRFNNGKSAYPAYSQTVYGRDKTVDRLAKGENEQPACLPVFGAVRASRASLAVVEEGSALANIHAGVLGENTPNNHAYASFLVRPFEVEEISLGGNEGVNTYAPAVYNGRLAVRYMLLGKDADYAALAGVYRRYLLDRGDLVKNTADALPFMLRLEGAVRQESSFLGIPFDREAALTTFDQARGIVEQLAGAGVGPVRLRYDACFNGGQLHGAYNKAGLCGSLGDKEALSALRETVKAGGGDVFLDADVQYVFDDGWFDGFDTYKDAAKTLNKDVAVNRKFNYGTLRTTKYQAGYVVSPDRYVPYLDGFLKGFAKLSMTGVSAGRLGSDVNSNFSKADPIHREQAREKNLDVLRRLRDEKLAVYSGGANAYMLGTAACLSDFPLQSSRKYIQDEEIPFYPIVVHGYLPYAGEAMNRAADVEELTLRSIEYGAAPYFDWVAADNRLLRELGLQTYSAGYAPWLQTAADAYRTIRGALQDVLGETITGHGRVAGQVYVTTYESGRRVYVNYGTDDYRHTDGTVVPARGYAKGEAV